ncbi:NAD-dependent epimerase/dehydratase family protein [Spirosoma areae]
MNVLLTGASGFVGSRIYQELIPQHTITTLGRTPVGSRYIGCDLSWQEPVISHESFELVINAAGKAHSRPRNSLEKFEYEQVNVQGVTRLLMALERLPVLPKSFVHISTILVYGCSTGQLLAEATPLNAMDSYGRSKIRAEAVVHDWAARTGVRVAILRLPVVVAEPLKGNLGAMQTAIQQGYYLQIGQGNARRSMVRADDVAAVITRAAAIGGTFHLTDGYHPTVRELEEALARQAGRTRLPVIPLPLAKLAAHIGDGFQAVVGRRFPLNSVVLQKLTQPLTFSDELARQQLQWTPRSVLDLFP